MKEKKIVTDGVDPLLRDMFERPYVPVETSMRSGDHARKEVVAEIKKESPGFTPQPPAGPSLGLVE